MCKCRRGLRPDAAWSSVWMQICIRAAPPSFSFLLPLWLPHLLHWAPSVFPLRAYYTFLHFTLLLFQLFALFLIICPPSRLSASPLSVYINESVSVRAEASALHAPLVRRGAYYFITLCAHVCVRASFLTFGIIHRPDDTAKVDIIGKRYTHTHRGKKQSSVKMLLLNKL